MIEVFADTSGWASAFIGKEMFHFPAAEYLRQWQADGTKVVTTNYVLTEVVALLMSPLRVPRVQQIAILSAIRTAAWVEVVHIDPALDAAAHLLMQNRPDKMWSLVDCSSIVVMQERGISLALTSDHHFEQAGLVRLLK